MVSNYVKYYKVIQYISTFTKKSKVGVVLGISNLKTIFDPKYYENLKGGIFEAFGVGFGTNIKLFVYPTLKENGKTLISSKNIVLESNLTGLLSYLRDNNKLEDIENADTSKMHIFSDQVLEMIKNGEEGWEELVPQKVAEAIKELDLFDYQPLLIQ